MSGSNWQAEQFEQNRDHLRAVAYRMLGSLPEADDAVQEAWLRFNRAGGSGVDNLGAWLTTVVARICLDTLRARSAHREESLTDQPSEPKAPEPSRTDPEREAMLADSVGLALLVVLDRLAPAERLAFVLHDMFDLSFDEIAPILGRSPVATHASWQACFVRRVRGGDTPKTAIAEQRRLVDTFLSALRTGDLETLISVLDPDVVIRTDKVATLAGSPSEVRGAEQWGRQAITRAGGARAARMAIIDGVVGLVIAPRGRLFRVLRFTFGEGRIRQIEVVGEPTVLQSMDLALPED